MLVFKDLRYDFVNSRRVIVTCCILNNVSMKWQDEIESDSSSSSASSSSSSSSSSSEDDEGDPYAEIPDGNDNFEGKT